MEYDKVKIPLFVFEVIFAFLVGGKRISKLIRLYYILLANIEYVPKQLA